MCGATAKTPPPLRMENRGHDRGLGDDVPVRLRRGICDVLKRNVANQAEMSEPGMSRAASRGRFAPEQLRNRKALMASSRLARKRRILTGKYGMAGIATAAVIAGTSAMAVPAQASQNIDKYNTGASTCEKHYGLSVSYCLWYNPAMANGVWGANGSTKVIGSTFVNGGYGTAAWATPFETTPAPPPTTAPATSTSTYLRPITVTRTSSRDGGAGISQAQAPTRSGTMRRRSRSPDARDEQGRRPLARALAWLTCPRRADREHEQPAVGAPHAEICVTITHFSANLIATSLPMSTGLGLRGVARRTYRGNPRCSLVDDYWEVRGRERGRAVNADPWADRISPLA